MNQFSGLMDIISQAAMQMGQPILFYNANNIRDLEAKGEVDKLNTVYAFFKELMSKDMYTEFFNSSYGAVTYNDKYTAQDFGEDYFPRPGLCPDADHYVYACVFLPNGAIEWENTDPPTSAGGESE